MDDRMKALLASYYAISDSSESGGGQQKDHSRDIDGAGFDAALYSSEMLQEESLPKLIAKEESLRGEIKSLDSSMQNLVYENYNKFIDATDTVRDMRSSVAEIEDTLSTLTDAMAKLGKTATGLSTALEPSRKKITQLVGVRGLLEKLEFLYDLPLRLQRAVELGAYSQAVRYYSAAAAVLARHEDVASLKKISEQARAIMVKLATTVRQQVEAYQRSAEAGARGGSLSAFIEHLRLLRTIGEPAHQLRDVFVAAHRCLLQSSLAQYLSGSAWGDDMAAFIAGMNDRFIDPLVTACERYEALFLGDDASAQGTPDEDGPVAVVLPVARVMSSVASEAAGAAGSAQAAGAAVDSQVTREELVAMAREVSAAYFEGVLSVITKWSPPGSSSAGGAKAATASQGRSTADALQPVLSLLLTDMRSASARLPELRLKGRASECVVSVLRHHSARMFTQSKQALQKQLQAFVGGYAAAVLQAKQQEIDDLAGTPPADEAGTVRDGADDEAEQGAVASTAAAEAHTVQEAATAARNTDGWRVHLGTLLRAQASSAVAAAAKDIAGATLAAAPLGAIGCALLPELDMAFRGVLVQEAVASLLWLVSMLESVGDPTHPALQGRSSTQLLRCMPVEAESGGAGAGSVGADSATTQRLRRQVDVPGLQTPTPQPAELLLVLAQACLVLAKEGVPAVLAALKSASRQLVSPEAPGSAMDTSTGMPAASDLRMRAAAAARRLTRRLVVAYGAKLSSTVRQSMRTADWTGMPEPRAPRLAVLLLLEELTHLREVAAGIVQGQASLAACVAPDAQGVADSEAGGGARNGIRLPAGPAARKLAAGLAGGVTARGGESGEGALQMGIDRIFSEGRSPALAALDMTVPAITACVAGLVLDTLLQHVRDVTLGTGGYQQLQVDVACMFLVLGATLARQKAFAAAQLEPRLREVLLAAEERCAKIESLPNSVVFAVASDGIRKMRLR